MSGTYIVDACFPRALASHICYHVHAFILHCYAYACAHEPRLPAAPAAEEKAAEPEESSEEEDMGFSLFD